MPEHSGRVRGNSRAKSLLAFYIELNEERQDNAGVNRMKMVMGMTLITLALLSGCAMQTHSPQTLREKLEGKTPEERSRTMRNICLTEAEWRQDQLISYRMRHYGARWARSNLPYMPDVVRLKSICWEMTKLYSTREK